jgi:heterogeneous nuclear ribonucleoprotein U-like protein 1
MYVFICVAGKVVPEEAVLEMKLNYSLPSESDEHVDEVIWIESSRDKAEELVQT